MLGTMRSRPLTPRLTNSPPTLPKNLPIRQGYLTKKGSVVKNWKRRWFILDNQTLVYYKNKGDIDSAGIINLDRCKITYENNIAIGKPYSFEIHTIDRIYYLYADSKEDLDGWLRSLQLAAAPAVDEPISVSYFVTGVHCERCIRHVEKAVRAVAGVNQLVLDPVACLLVVTGHFDMYEVVNLLEEAGFVASIEN